MVGRRTFMAGFFCCESLPLQKSAEGRIAPPFVVFSAVGQQNALNEPLLRFSACFANIWRGKGAGRHRQALGVRANRLVSSARANPDWKRTLPALAWPYREQCTTQRHARCATLEKSHQSQSRGIAGTASAWLFPCHLEAERRISFATPRVPHPARFL